MIIDSHCHLDYEPLNSNIESVLKRANEVGVKYFLTICTTNKSFNKILPLIKKYQNVYGTYGIHPHEAKNHTDINVINIKNKVEENKKIIGIGETGLDYYYNHSDVQTQKKSFINHINASQQTSRTLVVHSRSAEKDIYDILKTEMQVKKFNFLMHCFTGSKKLAHKLLDLGAYFSASGIITFKKNNDLSETFLSIPNDRILIETDSPYLSPEPLRGKPNEPSYLIHTVKFISDLKKIKINDFSTLTTNNFFKLFGKLN